MRAFTKLSPRRLTAVAAARAAIDTRFRPQGRMPGLGLDCIGVALLAIGGAGLPLPPLPAYVLGGDHGDLVVATCRLIGLRRRRRGLQRARPGDLIIFQLGIGNRHVGVLSNAGIIHAHAGLRRVVEGPLPPEWPVVAVMALPVR
jgi:cell wall-associated NlpC family hydrolase